VNERDTPARLRNTQVKLGTERERKIPRREDIGGRSKWEERKFLNPGGEGLMAAGTIRGENNGKTASKDGKPN